MATQFENESTASISTLEKCREITNCPTGVDLQDHLRKLAAESVGLRETVEAVRGVADNSSGIAGYHLNGDIAKWSEILPEIDDIETPATDRIVTAQRSEFVDEAVAKITESGALTFGDCIVALCQLREGAK